MTVQAPASVPQPDVANRPAPLPTKVGVTLLVLLALVSAFGAVMFGVFWADEVLSPGLVFTAAFLAAAATAVASVPGILRGATTAWLVGAGWSVAYTFWSVYKVFAEEEFESAGHLAAGIVVSALLLTPQTRRHVGL